MCREIAPAAYLMLTRRENDFSKYWEVIDIVGDPGAIRTRDPQIRNLVLYPAELRDQQEKCLAPERHGGQEVCGVGFDRARTVPADGASAWRKAFCAHHAKDDECCNKEHIPTHAFMEQ